MLEREHFRRSDSRADLATGGRSRSARPGRRPRSAGSSQAIHGSEQARTAGLPWRGAGAPRRPARQGAAHGAPYGLKAAVPGDRGRGACRAKTARPSCSGSTPATSSNIWSCRVGVWPRLHAEASSGMLQHPNSGRSDNGWVSTCQAISAAGNAAAVQARRHKALLGAGRDRRAGKARRCKAGSHWEMRSRGKTRSWATKVMAFLLQSQAAHPLVRLPSHA